MLYLSNKEVNSIINENLDFVYSTIKKVFQLIDHRDFSLGGKNKSSHGLRMDYQQNNQDNLFIAMPGYLGGEYNVTGLKWHGPMHKLDNINRDSNYTLILNNPQTGIPTCIMNANTITDYRTAGVSLLAAKALADKKTKKIGIVGPGKINLILAKGLLRYFDIDQVWIKGRSEESAKSFKDHLLLAKKNIKISICSSIDEVCANSEIVSINTGFNFKNINEMPFIREKYVNPGSTFLCSAFVFFSDQMIKESYKITDLKAMYEEYKRELGSPTYKQLSNLGNRYIDLIEQKQIAYDDVIDLSSIVCGTYELKDNKKFRLFSSGGLSLFDIALGYEVYKIAIKNGIGVNLDYE